MIKRRIAVLGAGSVGLGSAALAASQGHAAVLWGRGLPEGPGTLEITGALAGRYGVQQTADLARAVAGADAVLLTLPGFAHRAVLDQVVQHLAPGQVLIVSGHLSLGGLYAARRRPGLVAVGWGTTAVTGRRSGPLSAALSNVRDRVDAASVPASATQQGVALCAELFGDRFVPRADLVAITLSNLNPQNHLAMALCNLTRMERAEAWPNYWGVTPAVGRLMEALDAERLAIAAAFGVPVRTIFDHFRLSFGNPAGVTVAEMAATIDARGGGPLGPATLDTRYITEDVPFGLAVTEALAQAAGVPAPLHTGGIDLLSAAMGRNFRAENDLLPELALAGLDAGAVRALVA